ncbi:DUF6491 family protein [Parashewanella tropica]|uniref:DUF6491 family protein n=1 Tax=Parashewanella tropica TaxID=2547970 RepID=UPI00105A55FC|nr:DUF6491 family protein [Parashewanella tropica]
MRNLLIASLTAILLLGCATANRVPDSEKNAAYANYVKQQNITDVNKIRSFRYSGWKELTERYLILTVSLNKDYLVKFRSNCQGLDFANSIKIQQFTDLVFDKMGDTIKPVGEMNLKCYVDSIYPLTKEQSDHLVNIGKPKS